MKRALVNVNSRLVCVVVLKEIRSMVEHKVFYCRLLLLLMWWLLKEPFDLITYDPLMLALRGFGGPTECPWA